MLRPYSGQWSVGAKHLEDKLSVIAKNSSPNASPVQWFVVCGNKELATDNRQLTTDKIMHHASIRTANIHLAIAFYEQIGFTVGDRFTTGYTLACWMEGLGGRIELIQIPQPKPAPDAFNDEHYVGYYHLAFDVTQITPDLPTWLESLKTRLATIENLPPLKILLEPTQQQIGDKILEVAFIADFDGLPLEFLRFLHK